MKLSTFALGAFAVPAVTSLMIDKRGTSGVIQLQLHKRTSNVIANTRKLKSKRAPGSVSVPDVNYQHTGLYVVSVDVGTPPQTQLVQLDTGSSELVLETSSSDICAAAAPNPCTKFGTCESTKNRCSFSY
jgi:Eukaryotic aspartyl protease